MTKPTKIVLSAVFLFLFLPLTLFGTCTYRSIRYEQGILQIKEGQTREQVIELIGKPSEIKRCNSYLGKYDRQYPNGYCFEIYGYFTVFSYWAVAFDKDGKVIKTFRWTFDDGYGKPGEFDFPITLW